MKCGGSEIGVNFLIYKNKRTSFHSRKEVLKMFIFYFTVGITKKNSTPSERLFAPNSKPCMETICATIASPKPEPLYPALLSIVAQVLSMQKLPYGAENLADGVRFWFSIPVTE